MNSHKWAMWPRSFGGTRRPLIPNRAAQNKTHKKKLPFLEAFVGNEAPKFRGNPPTDNIILAAQNNTHKKRLPFLEAFVGNVAPKLRGTRRPLIPNMAAQNKTHKKKASISGSLCGQCGPEVSGEPADRQYHTCSSK